MCTMIIIKNKLLYQTGKRFHHNLQQLVSIKISVKELCYVKTDSSTV